MTELFVVPWTDTPLCSSPGCPHSSVHVIGHEMCHIHELLFMQCKQNLRHLIGSYLEAVHISPPHC